MEEVKLGMSAAPKTITVQPDSEVARLLDQAAERPVVIETGGARYRVSRDVAPAPPGSARRPRHDPARLLNIIGLGASTEGSDIARLKDRYVADAAAHGGG
jgi:hypothetical protein